MMWLLLFALKVPLGLDTHIPTPPDNPLRDDSIRLGRKLFFDKRLSKDNTLSCATCHDPNYAFTDKNPQAIGVNNQTGTRRSPAFSTAPGAPNSSGTAARPLSKIKSSNPSQTQ